jgi:hypothetical protein
MKRSPRVGDVFSIPVDDRVLAIGQVVGKYSDYAYYFAVFPGAFLRDDSLEISSVVRERPALLGLSFDARIADGTWSILGSAPVMCADLLPAFKEEVGHPEKIDVVDYSGTKRRRADSYDEAYSLPNRKFLAAIRIENAARALHGFAPWRNDYETLKPRDAATTLRLFGQVRSPVS